jgi:hypothetical protein
MQGDRRCQAKFECFAAKRSKKRKEEQRSPKKNICSNHIGEAKLTALVRSQPVTRLPLLRVQQCNSCIAHICRCTVEWQCLEWQCCCSNCRCCRCCCVVCPSCVFLRWRAAVSQRHRIWPQPWYSAYSHMLAHDLLLSTLRCHELQRCRPR